jgi:hypothetical protein
VHQVSYIDHWRAPQHPPANAGPAGHGHGSSDGGLVQIQ